jgi:hypothetical protein
VLIDIVLLMARLALAGVFIVAGVGKLVDRAGSRQAVIDFGVPAVLATVLGMLLPLVELALAVALLPAVTAWWAAGGILVLLALFLGGIGINVARGRRPACHCFGQLSSGLIGWKTVARNVALSGLAGIVVWQGTEGVGPRAFDWFGGFTVTEGLILGFGVPGLALLAGMTWLLVQLWQLIGRLLLRIDALEANLTATGAPAQPAAAPQQAQEAGLPVGTPAPAFRLDGLHSETLTLDALRARQKPVVLLFADPNCGPCTALMPEVGVWCGVALRKDPGFSLKRDPGWTSSGHGFTHWSGGQGSRCRACL